MRLDARGILRFLGRLDHAAHAYFDGLRALRVSAHFLIGRDGALTQFVSCAARAWHAGHVPVAVTVAELDPAVTEAARDWFWYEPGTDRILNADARQALQRLDR